MQGQYGDYEKYERNSTSVKDAEKPEELSDMNDERLKSVLESLRVKNPPYRRNVPEEYQRMLRYVYGTKVSEKNVASLKPPEEWNLDQAQRKMFKVMLSNRVNENGHFTLRLSPYAKQEMYLLHQRGWSVNELSGKFGVLAERVRAILWQKQVFWHEIYPKLGEAALRMGTRIELAYGKIFGFVDYGLDLTIMSRRENQLSYISVTRQPSDRTPPEEERAKLIDFYLYRKPDRNYTVVPERFIGKGAKGYMLKSIMAWRREGTVKPSRAFQDSCRYVEKGNHHLLHQAVAQRLHLGPRKASKGLTPIYYTH